MIDPVRYLSLSSTYDWLKFDQLTDEAKVAIEQQIEAIATKFSSVYSTGVTVLIPSGNQLNNRIAEIILSKCENGELIEGVICKLTTDEVDDIVGQSQTSV
jgi:hypothetical protein